MGIQEDLALFEQSLEQLIIRYEQYFLGMEKREPLKLLADVDSCARQYANITIVNTMMKFKYNSLVARLSSYKQYWNRINRLMEEGKYSRDRFKLEMHKGKKPPAPERPAGNSPEAERVYRQYLEACKECNLPARHVTPDLIAIALAKQKPAIIKKHKCEKVEVNVVIEDGKPKIKVRPKT